jgi:hypothetical protein
VIVDYDEETKYIGEPIVFELEPGQQCWYESTPTYFFGTLILDVCEISYQPEVSVKRVIYNKGSRNYYNFDVDNYLLEHPEVKHANIITNDNTNRLKEFTFDHLADRYNAFVDVKCPDGL